MKTFGRSGGKRGSRATSAAAYRAGERIQDERTGGIYDHQRRRDVMHKEIILPAKLAQTGRELDWARDRPTLWNAAEHAESRSNARVAREFVVALPHELTHEQRTRLTRQFAQELADRYGNAIDIAIHAPRGDPRNFHAHLLATTREITPDGLGPKTTLERSGTERHRLGLPRWREETSAIRERWASFTNEALERAHLAVRVSAPRPDATRSLQASAPRVPLIAYHIERRGGRSFLAERIRAAHLARVASAVRSVERTTTTRSLEQDGAKDRSATASRETVGLADRLRARAREAWVALSASLRGRAMGESRNSAARDSALEERSPTPVAQFVAPSRNLNPARTRDDAGSRQAPEPGELAREAAREWLRRYGRAAERGGVAAPAAGRVPTQSALDRAARQDREHEQGRGREHAQERDYGLEW